MKLSDHRKPRWLMLLCSAALLLSLGVNQLAQTTQQIPAPTGHVNDFAGVVDEKTKQQLENILANVKLKTGIEFDIATVESTAGQGIFDFSRELAKDWNIGARTSARKSLLLVVSVNEKTSFTQYSKSVQNDLPEGVLGEMGQLMRGLVDAGKFSEGLNAGVQHFVSALGRKLAFSTDDFDKAPQVASTISPAAPDNSSNKPTDEVAPAISRSTKSETGPATVNASATRSGTASAKTKKPSTIDDEAESEEVELTLTKPMAERIAMLRAFLDGHPDSKSRARATELLVSAQAALGDERLKKGDSAGGIEQLMLAIANAPVSPSEKLFAGVISQIPLNLYLRGEPAAATKAAQDIEAKFGNDPKRLVALSGFYIRTEQGAEATRLATQAVQLAPDLAEAHYGLGRALHISLRLDEAAAEYKRAFELDPNSKAARRSLADLNRAFGKDEEALALYRQQLDAEPADKAARTGLILSLLDLGRTDEARGELEKALQTDPRNLNLLAGAAYWFAAHNESDLALTLGYKAVQIEPRYTWSQVALARALVAQKKPLEAERALRFARQYGKFPTLDYELASALAAAGLYDEAAEVLMQSFSLKDGQIETRLGGQASALGANFIDLLAPERRASIFQSVAADTENNAKLLKTLLTFATLINQETNEGAIDEERATAAAKEFASGDDAARVHRQLYAASRLLQKGVGFQTAYELAEAARTSAEAGMNVPGLTLAVQADEFRVIRARAIAAGGTPDIPEAPRNVLSNLLRGRIENISGWALFNQDKLDEAVEHLKRAVTILPEGTPAARTSLWHLGVALERQDKKAEALSYYIKSYNTGEPDSVRRAVIEQLYRKVNGSLDGLDERIGPAPATQLSAQTPATNNTPDKTNDTAAQPTSLPESTPAATPALSETPVGDPAPTPSSTPSLSPAPETSVTTPQAIPSPEAPSPTPEQSPIPASTPSSEMPAVATPQPAASPETPSSQPQPTSPTPSPEATPEPSASPTPEAPSVAAPTPEPSPTSTPESTPAPASTPALGTSPVEKMDKPARATVTLTGRVKDASGNAIANVVVVLISPQGTVLASTTDGQGNYSFTVALSSSTHSYRIIPSKDGLTFEPVDRVLPVVSDDQKELDFVGVLSRKP
jgi:tetratricopeptide (TPR) repeat protein